MTLEETLSLLLLVNRTERRTMAPDDLAETAKAWHPIFGNHDAGTVREAWAVYLRTERAPAARYFSPQDLLPFIRNVKAARERIPSVMAIEPPKRTGLPDDWVEMNAWFKANPGKTAEDYERSKT